MASFVGVNNRVYLGQLDLSGLTKTVNFGDLSRAMQDATTMNDGGFTCVKPGLISGQASVEGYQDWASGGLDETISVGQLGSQYAFTVIPNPTGTVAAGDACWLSRGVIGKETLPMTVGEMAGFTLELGYDTAIPRGLVAAPLAAQTASGNGTAVALTGPTASQKLYAGLHVTAYSGFTNVVLKIQSDDNGGFSSATDRITFATVTGKTNEFASVAGAFASETHHRVSWTVTGSGSISFVCAFGVL